jgi:hypothetical protein
LVEQTNSNTLQYYKNAPSKHPNKLAIPCIN